MQHGAELHALNRDGHTAMNIALVINRTDIVCLLAKYERQGAVSILSPRLVPSQSLHATDRHRSSSAPRERPRVQTVINFAGSNTTSDRTWAHADAAKGSR